MALKSRKRYSRQYYLKNREKMLEYAKQRRIKNREYFEQYRIKNAEKLRIKKKQYYQKNKEKSFEEAKKWRKQNPEKYKESCMNYYHRHKEEYLERARKFRKENPNYRKEYIKKYQRINLKVNICHRMVTAIGLSLKGNKKGRHWEDLVGYSLNNLIKRLKKTLPKGYVWQDYLKGKLHIDHIIPIKAFTFNKSEDEEFKQCWSLYNLRLLPARRNMYKHFTIENPILLELLIKEGGF